MKLKYVKQGNHFDVLEALCAVLDWHKWHMRKVEQRAKMRRAQFRVIRGYKRTDCVKGM